MHQRGTVTTGRTSVWMTTNAKPCRLRDSTPTIPRSLRGSTLPDGNSRWVFEITAPRQHRAEPGTAGQSAVRTPPCRIGGRPESYGRRSMSTAGAQPAPGLVRADVRMGTAPAVEHPPAICAADQRADCGHGARLGAGTLSPQPCPLHLREAVTDRTSRRAASTSPR